MTDPPRPTLPTNGTRWSGIAVTPARIDNGLCAPEDLLAELEGLRIRLASQPIIEQAKGILMGHYRIGSDAAFDVLRRWSSHTNRKLREISELIVDVTSATGSMVSGRQENADLIRLIELLNHGHDPSQVERA